MKSSGNTLLKALHIVGVWMVILSGCLFIPQPASAVLAGANVLFILDGSGSMWGRLNNVEKIVIAKERMTELVQELPAEWFNLGLMVYGHRHKGDCDDIEMLTPLGKGDKATVIKQIQSVSPKGKTPITKSIALAAQQLETIEEEAEIVLVSDGEETCESDPCEYVRTLKDKGIKFTMYVVGFDVNDEQKAQLECIAKAGGGRYFSAQNAMQLKEAFTEVKEEVIKKVPNKEKVYVDTRGTEVRFALGDFSFADEVVSFEEGSPRTLEEVARQPEDALGPPDFDGDHKWGATLGCGGTLVLKFVDNVLIDVEGPDLYVFEIGTGIEPTFLAISKDGQEWIEVGEISGGKASIDISPFVQSGEEFRYVGLIDLKTRCNTDYPGADIDAVGAMGSVLKTSTETQSEEQEKQPTVIKRQTTVRRDIGTIKITNLKSREVYIVKGDKWIEKIQPNNPIKEMPAGQYGLAFVDDGSLITQIDLTGGETIDVVLGGISLPNLEGETISVIQKDSRYLAGKISSQMRFVELGAGTYRLAFGNYYVPITVETGKTTEFLLGSIRVPKLKDQAEVVTQQGDVYLGPIHPNVGFMDVPPGTYKVRISGQWIEGIAVGANDEIVIE